MITISIDETHHILNDVPLYNTRYTKVMSFHNNIAPVQLKDQAFFINTKNEKLFNCTYLKAYGFYEGFAAVCDEKGWFHIKMNGSHLYSQRYPWIGNFQESLCVVRDCDYNYFHINSEGTRIYQENYSYTGDFKYSIAVVINNKGNSTHINTQGKTLHNKYFEELEIFHKGYAVAKDCQGFFHIDKNGDELYSQRYQKLEPFYNGVALATSFKNQKIIINEKDIEQTILTQEIINKTKILNESFDYFNYQILFSILKLDVLKNLNEKKSISLPAISKKIIFRWLNLQNIINVDFSLTPKGKILETELKPIIVYWQDLPFKVSSNLVDALKRGDEVFTKMYGQPFFDYMNEHKSLQKLTSFMSEYYTSDYTSLVKNLSLSNEIVCDIGGGTGALLSSIKQHHKDVTTILVDKFKIETQHNFYQIDFFNEFSLKSDVYILSRVLHDWSDDMAIIILKNVVDNMSSNSILYIFETIVPENTLVDKGHTLSFHLLSFLGGYERTLKEYRNLLSAVNLTILDIYAPDNLISIMKVKK
jgi:hypothetical protein